jgi:hypothetical protein
MAAADLRNRYVEDRLNAIRDVSYPSTPMLDWCEAALRTREHVEQYAELLYEKVNEGEFPSPPMLRRLNRTISVVEFLEQREQETG